MALVVQVPILVLLSLTTCFSGLVMYYRFADCDPKTAGKIASFDQVSFITFTVRLFYRIFQVYCLQNYKSLILRRFSVAALLHG